MKLAVAAAVLVALATSAVAAAESRTSLTVLLQPEGGSRVRAVVAVRQVGPDLAITISVTPRNAAPLRARVRQGSCAKKNPRPSYRLNDVVNGKSVTILQDKKLSTLDDGDYVITIRKPKSTPYTYVSCGEVK
jgi:hypothetical protein